MVVLRGGVVAFSLVAQLASSPQQSLWACRSLSFTMAPPACTLSRQSQPCSPRAWPLSFVHILGCSCSLRARPRLLHTAMAARFSGGGKSKPKKVRIDELLVFEGLATDVKEAAALCMAGKVLASNVPVTSPAAKIDVTKPIRLRDQKEHPWVSRGGMKMAHALATFPVDVRGRVAVDVGCSTGGFTQVLLHAGAAKVYAVDVGYGQLALPLRTDQRVIVMERTNARNLTSIDISDTPSLIVCDASFIPIHKVLPAALALCSEGASLVALIKPQFEARREEIESGTGVVRDESVRTRVCQEVQDWLVTQSWKPLGLTQSPIKGPAGNVEFIVYAMRE